MTLISSDAMKLLLFARGRTGGAAGQRHCIGRVPRRAGLNVVEDDAREDADLRSACAAGLRVAYLERRNHAPQKDTGIIVPLAADKGRTCGLDRSGTG